MTKFDLVTSFCASDARDRARAWRALYDYYGSCEMSGGYGPDFTTTDEEKVQARYHDWLSQLEEHAK